MGEDEPAKVKRFGARKVAQAALADVARLRSERDELEAVADKLRTALEAAENEKQVVVAELARLGALDVAELDRRKRELTERIKQQRVDADVAALARRKEEQARISELQGRRAQADQEMVALRRVVVDLKDEAALQEVGVYRVRHPLADSVEYREKISELHERIKKAARADGNAVTGTTNWLVNDSAAQGRAMVRDLSKLMLRAYNGEADVLVRNMKPYKLDSAIERLNKAQAAIERLGKTMHIRISANYHKLRVYELELTADYVNQVAVEKQAEREEKARLREERKAQQEMERERQRLEKERAHYTNALSKLEAKGDLEGAARLESQLEEINKAIEDVDYRAANIRAGYVYVISNVGSFGEHMVKVGMTRRLDPIDRVRELSDASVPFNFDVHALFFSDDAVGIEQRMHQLLATRRVNQVNLRREFFYATPTEARDLLARSTGELLEFNEVPDAPEFRQSSRPA